MANLTADLDLDFHRPTWESFANISLFWPAVVQVALTVVFLGLSYVYVWAYNYKLFRRVVAKYIGRVEKPSVERPALIVTLNLLQMVFSFAVTIQCILKSYTQTHVREQDPHAVEIVLAVFFTFHYFLARLQAGFRVSSVWEISALVDVFTVVPAFLPGQSWLSLNYLRIYRSLMAYYTLQSTIDIAEVSDLAHFAFGFVLQTGTLVVVMGGTMFVLEVLGELPSLADVGYPTAADGTTEISFVQISYWMVTTISTVGYGDFAPQTVPSRIIIVIFIFLGCMFFGDQISSLADIRSQVNSGMGKYLGIGGHLILTGPGVSRMSTLLQTLLLEILETEMGMHVPDIVFLSDSPYEADLLEFVRSSLPPSAKEKIYLLRGNVMSSNDLTRVGTGKCKFVFMMPGTPVGSALDEDSRNILRVLEINRYYPKARVRLMLLEEQSERRAVTLGIPRQRCFNVRGLTANLLAHSIRVKGFVTFIAGLLQATSASELREAFGENYGEEQDWRVEYARSTGRQVYGFVIGQQLAGMAFSAAVAKVYQESDGNVLIVAAQSEGILKLNWRGTVEPGQVVVCIGTSHLECLKYADNSQDWRQAFLDQRSASLRRRRRQMVYNADENDEMAHVISETLSKISGSSKAVAEKSAAGVDSLREFHDSKTMVLLVLIDDSPPSWLQVGTLLSRLRDEYLSSWQPIVVVAKSEPPQHVANQFGDQKVAFVVGPIFKPSTLIHAGIEHAETVAVIRGAGADANESEGLADHEAVALNGIVERCRRLHRSGFTLYEFGSTNAARLIDRSIAAATQSSVKLGQSGKRTDVMDTWAQYAEGHLCMGDRKVVHYVFRVARFWSSIFRQLFCEGRDAATQQYAGAVNSQLLLQPRFARGEIFTPDFFGGMLGHIFHFPATIEFVEALSMPTDRSQSSFPYQVQCPAAWVGKLFKDLVCSWALGEDPMVAQVGPVLVVALYRPMDRPDNGPDSGKVEVAHEEEEEKGVSRGFHVTLPLGQDPLAADDLLTVLAPKEFGRALVPSPDGSGRLRLREAAAEPGDVQQLLQAQVVSGVAI